MSDSLRRRAEQRLAGQARQAASTESDAQRLLHELQVHQIELELQNEELRQAQDELRLRVDELRALKEAADSANRAKSEFLANVSHEIRTPLQAIVSLGRLLGQTASDEQAELVERLNHAGRHLLLIVDDILSLARIEAGRLSLEREVFDPREVLESVRDLVADAAAAKGLRLEVQHENLPPALLGDAVRLRQSLLNYAGNAVKFTERGGVVLRAWRVREEGGAAWLRFEVRDTGIGITPQVQARLFQPFEQGDASVTRAHGGTGLGLVLVKRLVEMMGGSVGVDSERGRGSCFWFTVRLDHATSPVAVARNDDSRIDAVLDLERRHAGKRIVLADDDRFGRHGIVQLLRQLNLKVQAVDDGAQALAHVMAAPPDLVLMDIRMPVMDGMEATRRIRALASGRELPIVALTANAFTDDRDACLAAGMDDFVAKPCTLEAIAEVLLRQWERRSARS